MFTVYVRKWAAAVFAAAALFAASCSESPTDEGPKPAWGHWVPVEGLTVKNPDSITAVGADPEGGVWVAVEGYDDGLYRWDGTSWEHVTDGGPFNHIDPVSGSDVWGTDELGDVWSYVGGQWDDYPYLSEHVNDLSMVSPDEGWFVGENGYVAHYQNGDFDESYPVSNTELVLADFAAPDDGWVVNADSGLYHWAGVAWSPLFITPCEVHDIQAENGGTCRVTGHDGNTAVIARFTGSSGWRDEKLAGYSIPQGVVFLDQGEGWVFSHGNNPCHFRAGEWRLDDVNPGFYNFVGAVATLSGEAFLAGRIVGSLDWGVWKYENY